MMRDHDDVHDEELRHAARRLGATAADRLDVERTAQAVLSRLRAGDDPARGPIRWMQPAWLRAAAVVVVVLGAGVVFRATHPPLHPVVGDSTSGGPDVLAGVSRGALQTVLSDLNEPLDLPGVVHAGDAGVEDLSEPQLQSLLKAMED